MSREKTIEFFRAEQIAQLYLQSTQKIELLPNFDEDFDFVIFPIETHQKQIGVEVKATKLTSLGIEKKYLSLRRRYRNERIPIMILYINTDSEKGFFEIINKKDSTDIMELNTESLSREIEEVFRNMKTNKLWFES